MKKILYPLFGLGLLMMASCTNDEPRPELNQYVTINRVGVGSLSTRAGYEATDNFLPENGTMKLLLNSSNSEAKYSTSGLDFTPSAEGWTPATPLPWAVNSTADWSVFFTSRPMSEYSFNAETRELTWSVPADQSTLTEEQFNGLDLLYAGGNTSTANISPSLKHAMAKIRLNIHFDRYSTTMKNAPYLNVYGGSTVLLSKNLNIETGKDLDIKIPNSPNTDASVGTYKLYMYPITMTETFAAYEAIIIPQAIDSSFEISFEYTYNNPAQSGSTAGSRSLYLTNNFGISKFESGKLYTINSYPDGKEGQLGDVTISTWEEIINTGGLVTEE